MKLAIKLVDKQEQRFWLGEDQMQFITQSPQVSRIANYKLCNNHYQRCFIRVLYF